MKKIVFKKITHYRPGSIYVDVRTTMNGKRVMPTFWNARIDRLTKDPNYRLVGKDVRGGKEDGQTVEELVFEEK